MAPDRQNRNTAVFLGVLALAGVCNLFTRSAAPFVGTLMFCLNFALYAGLLLFWLRSVRERLLPTKARSYIVAAGLLMLSYLLLRVIKYRAVLNVPAPSRYAVYAYWTPQILIPTLFLMLCLRIRRGEDGRGARDEWLLLIPACALALMVMTNDLHGFVYRPRVAVADFFFVAESYTLGPGFYLLYAWMGLTAAAGLFLLLMTGRRSARDVLPLLGLVALWFALIECCMLFLNRYKLPVLFNIPDIHIFCMLGFLEICIRRRLIPYNENYTGFFSALELPVLITDRALQPVYETNAPLPATPGQLRASLSSPLYLQADTRLSGMPLGAGCVFWTEDETALHRERRRLDEANELLSEENELITVENELREKQAHLDAQDRVYDRIAAALCPKQKQIKALLAAHEPGTPAFSRALGLCCVLNAWSKRKSNLLLLSDEELPRPNRELFLALQDSARFLKYCGVEAAAMGEEYSALPLPAIHALYDAFETIVEALLPALKRMTVSITRDGVRLAIETDALPPLPETGLKTERRDSEGYVFLTLHAPEEEVAQ